MAAQIFNGTLLLDTFSQIPTLIDSRRQRRLRKFLKLFDSRVYFVHLVNGLANSVDSRFTTILSLLEASILRRISGYGTFCKK